MTSKLADVCTIKYGKDHERLADGKIPVYGSGGVIRYVDTALYSKKSVLIPRIGTLDNLFFVSEPFWTINTLFYTEIDETKAVPEYIYYFLKTLNLARMNVGSAVPNLRAAVLNEIEIDMPPIAEQQAIADTLSALDDKIANNTKINHHLEQMAQAIFKSWFVNFEPFGGEMPSDWREGTIVDACSAIYNGGTPRRNEPSFWNGTIPWLISGEVHQAIIIKPENCISEIGLKGSSAKWIPSLSTVVALYGATAGQVSMAAAPLTTNQAICALVPKDNYAFYNYLVMRNAVAQLENKAIGSAQQNISKAIVEETFCLIADDKAMTEFNKLVSPFFNEWIQNLFESDHLATLRDSLLPRLMSGELSISDVDAK